MKVIRKRISNRVIGPIGWKEGHHIVARKTRNLASPQTHEQPARKKKKSKLAQKEMRVLVLIHENHDVSRIELAKLTGASAGSMTAMVHRLISKGLVVESARSSSSLGRKPVALSLRKDLGYVVGVDLGSYLTRVVVTDTLGNPSYKAEIETRMADGRLSLYRSRHGNWGGDLHAREALPRSRRQRRRILAYDRRRKWAVVLLRKHRLP